MSASTDRPNLVAQTRQFDENPARGESLLNSLAEPSAAAVAAEAWSRARVADPIVNDDHGNRVSGYVVKPNPAPLLPQNRDAFRDENDSASTPDPAFTPGRPSDTALGIYLRSLANRDPYRDQMDSTGIYHGAPTQPPTT